MMAKLHFGFGKNEHNNVLLNKVKQQETNAWGR
jgi:hypothetical protein